MTTARRGRLGMPIWAQIVALLMGSLVVAQLVTLALAMLLPPPPAPQYRLQDIASALKGGPLKSADMTPLRRDYQAAPPANQSRGWQVSETARLQLADMLGARPEDVRLLFYSPPPFAGLPQSMMHDRPFETRPLALEGRRNSLRWNSRPRA